VGWDRNSANGTGVCGLKKKRGGPMQIKKSVRAKREERARYSGEGRPLSQWEVGGGDEANRKSGKPE